MWRCVMSKKMRICISSPPDREKLVVEFFSDDEQWAELNQEGGTLNLELYPKRDGEYWSLDFVEAVEMLNEGKRRLVGDES